MIKEFLKPSNVKEALKMKKEMNDSFYLGGGTKLNNSGENYSADILISLENLNLKGIVKMGEKVKIGSGESLQDLLDSSDVPQFLKDSISGESNRNIRNASTLGGQIAAAKSYSTTLAGLMAMDAEIETADEGILNINDYVKNDMNDLILNVFIPQVKSKMYRNDQRVTANSRPEITAAVSIGKSGDSVSKAIIVLGGLEKHPIRLISIEKKLLDGSLTNADAVQDAVQDEILKNTEKMEKGTYLNYISGVMVADCVGRCMR